MTLEDEDSNPSAASMAGNPPISVCQNSLFRLLFVIAATCWGRQLLTNTEGLQAALRAGSACLGQSLPCIQHENNENNLFCSLAPQTLLLSLAWGLIGDKQIMQVEVVIFCKQLEMGDYIVIPAVVIH